MKRLSWLAAVLTFPFLAGCVVGPNYKRPAVAVPQQWPAEQFRGTTPAIEPATEDWWKSFHDAELESLVTRAVAANLDMKIAAARVEEARASHSLAKSDAFPQVSADVSASRERRIAFLPNPSGGPGAFRTVPNEFSLFSGTADMSWEIDLFGRVRREVEAARADLAAQQEDRRNVLITLLGDVGTNYAQVRGFQLRLAIAQKNIAIQQDTLDLTRQLADAGQATDRDVAQAETLLETTQSTIFVLDSGLQSSIHRLSVLLALEPDALTRELRATAPLPVAPLDVPVGLPSDLLKRRPDIRRAEAQLHAATARIGQAKAAYFPSFSLTGSAGREATQLHELTLGASNIFSIGPSITLPLFTGGRIRSNVAVQTARTKQAEATYESTVLKALEETDNALVSYSNEQGRRERLQEVVRSSQKALNLANIQYKAGLVDFLTVLDSERTLFSNEDQLAQSQVSSVSNLISLYKALGGGWASDAATPPPPQAASTAALPGARQ